MKDNGCERDTLDGVIADLEKVKNTWRNDQNKLNYATLRDALHYLYQLKLFRQTQIMQGIHKMQKEYALYPVEDWEEKKEITLDRAIELMDTQVGELGVVTGVCLYAEDIRDYLIEYRDLLNKPRHERLMDILREVRGEKNVE